MDFEFTKEQKDIARAAREFAEKEFPERAEEFDANETFDEALFKKAADLGFIGMYLDEKYGGAGLGLMEQCILQEEFAAVDAGISTAILTSCFGSEVIQEFGTEEQKQTYLPPLTRGEKVMGSAFTEPDAGSDLASATTSGVIDGDDLVINGNKMFITNGKRASFLICFVMTDPDNPKRHKRFSMYIVETGKPGYDCNKLTGKLGIRASETTEIAFSDYRVPLANILGKPGDGWNAATYCFNRNRIIVAAQALGLMRAALTESIKHVKKRQVFGAPLASYQATQFKLADMFTWMRAAKNMVYESAWRIDQGRTDPALVAATKAFCGQMAVRCADMALQLHGGYGYLSDYKVNRIYRDVKITEIYEGTTEVEKTIVAKSLLA